VFGKRSHVITEPASRLHVHTPHFQFARSPLTLRTMPVSTLSPIQGITVHSAFSTSSSVSSPRLLVGLVCPCIMGGCAPTLLPLNIDVGKISVTKEPVSVAVVIQTP